MQLAVSVFYLFSGLSLFLGILSGFLAVFGYSRKLLIWLCFLALASSGYLFTGGLYYAATDFQQATTSLHWQTVFLLFCFPASYGFIGTYTHERYTGYWVAFGVASAVVLLLLDLSSDVSVFFGDHVEFVQFEMPWGEVVSQIVGSTGFGTFQLYMSALVLLTWGFWRAFHLRETDLRRFYFLMAFLGIQALTVIHAGVVEFFDFYAIKVVGASYLVLVVLASANIVLDLWRILDQYGIQRDQLQMERSITQVLKHDQERLSQVVSQSPSSIYLLDETGMVLQRNVASRNLWADDSECGDSFYAHEHWKKLGLIEPIKSVLVDGRVRQLLVEVDAIHLQNESRNRWIHFTVFPITAAGGVIEGVTVASIDVTRQQTIEGALKVIAADSLGGSSFFYAVCEQIYALLGANFVYIAEFSEDTDAHHYHSLAFYIGGKPRDDFSGNVQDESHSSLGVKSGLSIINTGAQTQFPNDRFLAYYNIDGVVVLPLTNDKHIPIGYIGIMDSAPFDDLTDVLPVLEIVATRVSSELERLSAESRIRRMAYEDYVTRLPNRAMLHEHLTGVIRHCECNDSCAAAYFLDLDHFKTINEALGHDVGDDVLRRTGDRLRASFSESVFVARVGGDEFVLIEEFTSADNIDAAIECRASDIIHTLSQPLALGERLVSLGTSLGVLKIPEHANSELDVMRRGDSALYRAKNEGRNRFEIYDPSMQDDVDERLEVERGLRIALETCQLEVFYQPKVDCRAHVVGAEALIRWNHPTHGFISPATFIPVAEETGLIHLIGDWMMDSIAADLARWEQTGIPDFGDISINISAWQFARPDFISKTLTAIGNSQIPVHRFSVEVTETAILRDINVTKAKLAQLRDFGIQVALDDFGTGYSSLAYLKDLPLDSFKVDRAFVDGLVNSQTAALVNSMIAIGGHMNLDVVAEGVETEEQFEKLKQMGCKIFQGYLFAKPMPESDFVQWLQKETP